MEKQRGGLIQKEFGVEYTHSHVWELLKAAGFSLQRPLPRHHKAPSKKGLRILKKATMPAKRDSSVPILSTWFASTIFFQFFPLFPPQKPRLKLGGVRAF